MAIAKKNIAGSSASPSGLHPPYFEMISEAITTMKDRTGSSQPAIAKFIEEKYTSNLPRNFRKIVSAQLKRLVKSEKLVKVKNSYKISPLEKVKKPSSNSSVVPDKTAKKKTVDKKQNAEKETSKGKKTKSLSQVKTPEALEKKTTISKKDLKESVSGGKTKRLSEVKSPQGSKKKGPATPAKVATKLVKSRSKPAAKRAKKN